MVNPLPSKLYRRRRPPSGGFTLIEVLAVIIIAAVLAGIAAPGWLAFLNRQRVNAVKSDLVQTLKKAQADAIQRRQEVAVEIVTAATTPTVTTPTVKVGKPQRTGGAITGVGGPSQTLGDNNANPGGITLTAKSLNASNQVINTNTRIIFDYQGLPTSDSPIPFIVGISPQGSSAEQCVVIANLLGSVKTADNRTQIPPNNLDACNPGAWNQ
jgi:prepilin-type N-terminal cleavage/methylation domain-containing protein